MAAGEGWKPNEIFLPGPRRTRFERDELFQGVQIASRVACLREVSWARFEPNFFVLFPEGPLKSAPQSFVLLSRLEDPVRL